jgi:uroporphyrinogen III methyltransferase / synthase
VTRARRQASVLTERIERLGGEAIEFPVIEIAEPKDLTPLRSALKNITSFQWIVFTSVNAVEACFKQLMELRLDIRSWSNVKIAAVGDTTADALLAHGIVADLIPDQFVSESLVAQFQQLAQKGERVLLPRADIANKLLPENLRALGLDVVEVDAYETRKISEGAELLIDLLEKKAVHFVTFTSSSTVRNFVDALKEQAGDDVGRLLQGVKTACIGPITAQTAESIGLHVDTIAETHTIDGLIQAIMKEAT